MYDTSVALKTNLSSSKEAFDIFSQPRRLPKSREKLIIRQGEGFMEKGGWELNIYEIEDELTHFDHKELWMI